MILSTSGNRLSWVRNLRRRLTVRNGIRLHAPQS